jgi:hypothetical protein
VGYDSLTDAVVPVMVKRILGCLLLAFGAVAAASCGDGTETCTCTCTCGSGAKSTVDGAESNEGCSQLCDDECGNDSYESYFECTTKG